MPRGRHRHSPPLHRLLPPSAIAGVSLVCALGPWVFTEPGVLRVSAAVAAATAAVGAAVMRRWDVEAGKRVADLTRARASDEWRYEEQVAELETDLEESRELRQKLEHKLRAKRAELAGLRNEHAALLRRYATAETERASALEGRRRLAIEASEPAPATAKELPSGSEGASGDVREQRAAGAVDEKAEEKAREKAQETGAPVPGAFSPAGASLFLRANSALDRIIQGGSAKTASAEKARPAVDGAPKAEPRRDGPAKGGSAKGGSADGGSPDGGSPRPGAAEAGAAPAADAAEEDDHPEARPRAAEDQDHGRVPGEAAPAEPGTGEAAVAETGATPSAATGTAATDTAPAPSASSPAARPALPSQSSGHFTVPTAVAVAPATPRRRLAIEGGFDFFGTQKGAAAIEAVQNEDLADVVGQEALALHKAESEARFKPADAESRGVGQVIDLTAHDETEQIDVEGLRSAAS